jgi:antitoxin HicB
MAAYRIELTPDDNDTIMATCPAMPGVVSFGDDEAGALRHAGLAIEERIAALIHDGQDIPGPDGEGAAGPVAFTSLLVDLKADLYRASRAAGVTRAELVRRLGWNRNSVDRLFDLNHASRLEQIEAAMLAIGFRVNARLVRVAEPA